MANSNATALVEHAATITHLQCVDNPDGSHKFQFLKHVVRNGRKYGLFAMHDELFAEVKRFDIRMKANSKKLKAIARYSSTLHAPDSAG